MSRRAWWNNDRPRAVYGAPPPPRLDCTGPDCHHYAARGSTVCGACEMLSGICVELGAAIARFVRPAPTVTRCERCGLTIDGEESWPTRDGGIEHFHMQDCIDRLRAEVEAMRPVVDAAREVTRCDCAVVNGEAVACSSCRLSNRMTPRLQPWEADLAAEYQRRTEATRALWNAVRALTTEPTR